MSAYDDNTTWIPLVVPAQADAIASWRKKMPDSPHHAFKGCVTVEASMLPVLTVLSDTSQYHQWIMRCRSAKPLSKIDPALTHFLFYGFGPVKPRDAVLRNSVKQNLLNLSVTVHSTLEQDCLSEAKNVVRMPLLKNTFVIEPVGKSRTRITFYTHADPGGRLPAWFVNLFAKSTPFVTLKAMQKCIANQQTRGNRLKQSLSVLQHTYHLTFPRQKNALSQDVDNDNEGETDDPPCDLPRNI